jgi:hypothetical protein
MGQPAQLLICSDIHYAGPAEKARGFDYEIRAVPSLLQRIVLRNYRKFIWLRDPFAHNDLLHRVLDPGLEPDLAIANGDFSCDTAFIGVADPAARQSAQLCLGKLRQRYGERFAATIGDHELGKVSMAGGRGGIRLESLRLAQEDLGLETCWTRRLGRYVLIGMTSTLAAIDVYGREALPEEEPQWREIAREHKRALAVLFNQLRDDDRVLLFCHDPTALPCLWEIGEVRRRAAQIERTIIGHLHTELVLWQSRLLGGMPAIGWCGPTVRRLTLALAKAKVWRHFNVLLCPNLAGVELLKRGGFYLADIDPDARRPAQFRRQTIDRR